MSWADRVGAMQNRVARHFEGTTATIINSGSSGFSNFLEVTVSATSATVPCSVPRKYVADGEKGDQIRAGSTFILIDRSNSSLTIEPQEGHIVEVSGEQYRVEAVDYLPGAVRVFLRGGAAEGTASA